MYFADSEEEEEKLIIKFSAKKVTINESKNRIYIFNETDPPKPAKYLRFFQRK